MNLGAPMSTVVPGVPGVVMAILARSGQPLTGRNIASLAGGRASQAGVSRSLRELVRGGVVIAVPAGAATLYSLNPDHLAYQPIRQLSLMRDALLKRIRSEIHGWGRQPVTVALFGSAARGAAGVESDIDLLVVRPDDVAADDPDWATQIEVLSGNVLAWTGNGCEVLEYAVGELSDLALHGEPLLVELRRDAVDLYGEPVQTALAARGAA